MENNYCPYFNVSCLEHEKLYSIDMHYRMLLEYDLNSMLYSVISYNFLTKEQYECGICAIFKKGFFFYIVLNNHGTIVVYNTESGENKEISFLYHSEVKAICTAFMKNEKIYCFPASLQEPIRVFDIEKQQFISEIDYCGSRDEFFNSQNNYDVWRFISDEGVYAVSYRGNVIILFSFDGHLIKKFNLPENVETEKVTYDYQNKCFAFTSKTDKMLRIWSPDKGIIGQYEISCIKRFADTLLDISDIYCCENYVLCVANDSGIVSYIDRKTNEEICIDMKMYCKKVHDINNRFFTTGVKVNNRILLIPGVADSFAWVDMNTGCVEAISSKFKKEDIEIANCLQALNSNDAMLVNEDKGKSLQSFLEVIINHKMNYNFRR